MIGSESRTQGRKSPERSAETRVYVGIDVWKDRLDVDIHPIGRKFRVPNTPEGLKFLKRQIVAMPDALIVMEATAKYHRQPHRTLHAAGYAVAIVNPLRARLFAEAFGQFA
ncbi:MAG: transposase [Methylocella sp.]